jgi:hypothetical protein
MMPRQPKKKPDAHWYKDGATPEALQHETVDRIEARNGTDIVLKLHGLTVGDLCRIDTPRCWCADPAEITSPVDRMVVGNTGFRCMIHNREITIRRALDPLMKTKEKRAELLERHPALQGIRDGLFKTYFCFEAGAHFEKRSIGEHQATALAEVGPSRDKPLRGLVIEAINDDAADRASDGLDEAAPWREGLQHLLNAGGELAVGWHGSRLTPEEQYREARDAGIADYRKSLRDLRLQAQERLANEIKSFE